MVRKVGVIKAVGWCGASTWDVKGGVVGQVGVFRWVL